MTLVPEWRRCPKCHKIYDWNPDVGQFQCPYCMGIGPIRGSIFKRIFGEYKSSDHSDSKSSGDQEE